MGVMYFKRFRMELDLQKTPIRDPALPESYAWMAWGPALLDRHAAVKYASFRSELDSQVFPCLGEPDACRRLMQDIAMRTGFLPQATWLIGRFPADGSPIEDCGTIQGLAQEGGLGAIQNVGIAPEHRGLGLGRALVLKALHGFRAARMRCVYLEVTAKNTLAVQLYRSIGFRLAKTTYKTVEVETPVNSAF